MTSEELATALGAHEWVFAKTMADNPHEYTLREEWDDERLFEVCVEGVRAYGKPVQFRGTAYLQFASGNYTYWTMGYPASRTTLINRKRLPRYTEGQVRELVRKRRERDIIRAYNRIAPGYDDFGEDTARIEQENAETFAALGDVSELSVLDVGCGTGVLLDFLRPRRYLGIDPSQGMLDQLLRKHPDRHGGVRCSTLGAYLAPGPEQVDLAVALFGVASYLSEDEVRLLPSAAHRVFAMFYAPGYQPGVYYRTGVRPRVDYTSHDLLSGNLTRISNYVVVDTG